MLCFRFHTLWIFVSKVFLIHNMLPTSVFWCIANSSFFTLAFLPSTFYYKKSLCFLCDILWSLLFVPASVLTKKNHMEEGNGINTCIWSLKWPDPRSSPHSVFCPSQSQMAGWNTILKVSHPFISPIWSFLHGAKLFSTKRQPGGTMVRALCLELGRLEFKFRLKHFLPVGH